MGRTKFVLMGNVSEVTLRRFNKDFIKNYNKDSDVGYFLEVDIQYPESLEKLHNDLPFLPKRMKLERLKNF